MIQKIGCLLFSVVFCGNVYAGHPENEAGPSEECEHPVKPYIFRATHSSGQMVHFLPTIHNLHQSALDSRYRDWVQHFLPDICVFEHPGHVHLSDPQFKRTPPEVKELHAEIVRFDAFFDKARRRGALTFSDGSQWSFPDSAMETRVVRYLETINFILDHYNIRKLPELDREKIFTTRPAYVAAAYTYLRSHNIMGGLVWTLYQLKEEQRLEQLLAILPASMRTKFAKVLQDINEDPSAEASDQEDSPIDDVMDELPNAPTTMHVETEEDLFLSFRPDNRPIETLMDDFSFEEEATLRDIAPFFASWALTNENLNKFLAKRHSLLDREAMEIRNHNWARKYLSFVHQNEFIDKKVLAVHGVGHFPGEAGIINLMSQQGWCWDIYDYAQQKFISFSDPTVKSSASTAVAAHSLAQ